MKFIQLIFDDKITKSFLDKNESVDVKKLDGIEKESNLIPKVNPKKSKTIFFICLKIPLLFASSLNF